MSWFVIAEPCVQFWMTSCGILAAKSAMKQIFFPSFLDFLFLIIIPKSESKLLYDWRFTASQFVLAPSPLRITT
jgi:hypothetical protein